MKIFTKKKILVSVASVLGVILLLVVAAHYINFSLSESEIKERFADAGVDYRMNITEGVEWVESGNPDAPLLIFIHGSPGSWDNFIEYLTDPELTDTYRMISLSRPGYGETNPGSPTPSLLEQAAAVSTVIPDGDRATVIGHSMGAPIAVRLAMDSPENVLKIVLLSAAIDPDLEKVKWFQQVANWPWLRWILPDTIAVCNQELLPLREELQKMEPYWSTLTHPIVALHGTEDGLVPVENMDYLKTRVSGKQLDVRLLKGADHFIPWTHFEDVKKALLD